LTLAKIYVFTKKAFYANSKLNGVSPMSSQRTNVMIVNLHIIGRGLPLPRKGLPTCVYNALRNASQYQFQSYPQLGETEARTFYPPSGYYAPSDEISLPEYWFRDAPEFQTRDDWFVRCVEIPTDLEDLYSPAFFVQGNLSLFDITTSFMEELDSNETGFVLLPNIIPEVVRWNLESKNHLTQRHYGKKWSCYKGFISILRQEMTKHNILSIFS